MKLRMVALLSAFGLGCNAFSTTRNRLVNGSSRAFASRALSMSSNAAGQVEAPPLMSALQASQLMYEFENLRSIVSRHEKTFNEDLPESEKKERGIVEFLRPELVDTRNSVSNPFPAAKLRNPITAAAVLEFLKLNQAYIRHVEGSDMEFAREGDNVDVPFITKKLEELNTKFDGDIVEFDDEFAMDGLTSTLVYAIVVNRTHKRITVVFRGSVTPKDWLVDLRGFQTTPDIIRKIAGDDVDVHRGFAGYLLEESYAEDKADGFDEDVDSKYNQILSILKELYTYKDESTGRDYSDYSLFISGHSLGGALTQLLGFVIAGDENASFIPKPINAVSFASPIVGNAAFLRAYQELERSDKLRHLRVSNQNDVVPVEVFGYTQTGVNMHLVDGKMEVKYLNGKSLFSQASVGSVARHNLEGELSHYSRLFNELNEAELSKSMDELYAEHAGIGI